MGIAAAAAEAVVRQSACALLQSSFIRAEEAFLAIFLLNSIFSLNSGYVCVQMKREKGK